MTDQLRRGYFHPGLASGRLDNASIKQLATFLASVARVRALALCVPTAFNALAFGFDVDDRRYASALIVPEELPVAKLDDTVKVLPSGALLQLTTASQPLACEVLYREGEHAELEPDGSIPSWLSGAPQGATGPLRATLNPDGEYSGVDQVDGSGRTVAVSEELLVRERLVIDYSALDPAGSARVRRLDTRWLTPERHLVVVSHYLNAEEADLPESRLYTRYLLRHQRPLVARLLHQSGLGPEQPEDWTGDSLAVTLATAMATVERLLGISDLVQWRESWIHRHTLDAFTQARHGVGPEEVEGFARGLAKRALGRPSRRGSRPDKPAYRALGPALRGADNDRIATEGLRYGTTIACANLTLTELLESRQRALDVMGSRVHVRLDDAFQGGGVWRAEKIGLETELDPVDLPLALGWRESAEPAHPRASWAESDVHDSVDLENGDDTEIEVPFAAEAEQPSAADEDPALPEPQLPTPAERDPTDTRCDDTIMCWTVILSQRAQDASALRLTNSVADTMDLLGAAAPFQIRFHHPGIDPAYSQQPVTLEGNKLVGVTWPRQLFTGMRLFASWSRDGYFITVEGRELSEPVILEGIPLDYEFDEEAVLRSWGTPTDLIDPDELLGPAVVLRILRLGGLRATNRSSTLLYLPWDSLLVWLRRDGRASDIPSDELALQAEQIVEALCRRLTPNGSLVVEWAIGLPVDDPLADQGRYLRPLTVGERADRPLHDLAVTLRLNGKASERRVDPVDSWVAGSLRRGHPRVLTRGTPSAAKRAELFEWAEANGVDRSWLDPRTTFVKESEVGGHNRRID
jgi:hypothetical protein